MDLARESFEMSLSVSEIEVSILVLMDLAREFARLQVAAVEMGGFNPCFNGSCSRISCAN